MKVIDEFSPRQCLVLCLISSQERAKNINNQQYKINLKNKQTKKIFYLKSKLK